MNYLFFLILFLIPMGLVYGEVGQNYDDNVISINPESKQATHKWTSHYNRVFDGANWQNYILTNDAEQINFTSDRIKFIYDKTNCEFKLYDPLTNNIAIDSYKFDISVNATIKPLTSCNIIDFQQLEDLISFTINYDEFQTLFNITSYSGLEWSHEVSQKNGLITITETCKNCIADSIKGDLINFGDYTLDTKNEIHNTVKDATTKGTDFEIVYEAIITDKDVLIIDPTFTSNDPTLDMTINTNVAAGASCPATSWTKGNSTIVNMEAADSGAASGCSRGYFEWDITSIASTADVTDVDFSYDVQSVSSARNCDYMEINNKASVTSAANVWTDIGDGTVFLDADSACTTAADNKSVDLSATADLDVESHLSVDWWAVGVKLDSEARDGSSHNSRFVDESGASPTPSPTLTIVYNTPVPVNSVQILTATNRAAQSISLNWTQPNVFNNTFFSYQINSTTPWSKNVNTVLQNGTTANSTHTFVKTGLIGNTQYSFRIGVWAKTPVGASVKNMSGIVYNVTTNNIEKITSLIILDSRPTAIDLDWNPPTKLNNLTITGYQVNKTTPWNKNVATIVKNKTLATETAWTVGNLTGLTNYTFRIGVWTSAGGIYKNMSGNNVNGTTEFDPTAQFTVGSFDISQTNPDVIDIRFERDDIDTDSLYLNVTYLDTYDLACDMDYVIGGFNQTYTNLSNVTIDSSHVESYFWFTNVTNDIIRVDCWNLNNPDQKGSYLIERYDRNSTFPLLLQFEQFRDGTFGTEGYFGFFDIITLSAIILSMIGFNRVNPAVGVIFCVVVITFLGWFEIIEMPTIIFSVLALLVMLAIGVTRSDQS